MSSLHPPLQYLNFLHLAGISKRKLDEETVELSFRKRVDAFVLYRVLSGHDYERVLQLVSLTVKSYLSFLHRLEQSRLSLWRRSVYFIREKHVCEYWAPSKIKISILHIVDVGPGDIRG